MTDFPTLPFTSYSCPFIDLKSDKGTRRSWPPRIGHYRECPGPLLHRPRVYWYLELSYVSLYTSKQTLKFAVFNVLKQTKKCFDWGFLVDFLHTRMYWIVSLGVVGNWQVNYKPDTGTLPFCFYHVRARSSLSFKFRFTL